MARQYRYVSGDSHLEIDSKQWTHRVAAQYRDRAPRVIRLPDGGDAWLIEGRPLREVPSDLYGGKGRERWWPFGQNYETTPGTGSAVQRLSELDRDGIDAEVLFPGVSGPAMWASISEREPYLAVVQGYNDFLAEEYCSADRERLIGLGAIPWTGIDDALAELERCKRLGLRGIAMQAYPSGKGSPSASDDRFWAAALEMQMPIAVHEELDRHGPRAGRLLQYPKASPEVLARIPELRDFCGQMAKFGRLGGVNAIQMTLDGVFDRFPDLRIFFAETQIGWLPFFLEMCDVRYERHSLWAEQLLGHRLLEAPPSEYIKRHCYWGFQHDFVGVELRHHLNVERLVWAVDFPHQDSEWPNSQSLIERQFGQVPAEETRRMVAQNAIDFFHLDATPAQGAAPHEAARV